jgi:cell division transport system ATP-binding protein
MIQFSHVTKTYPGPTRALSDISLKIKKGEFVFLTGASGAGKTTLLKMIYMDIRPDAEGGGQVLLNLGGDKFDSKTADAEAVQALRRKMGIVFQDFKLLRDRTVYENVTLALRVTDTPAKEIKRKAMEALALVGLAQRLHAEVRTLSGGEQQRVAIARAVVNNPYLLIADEPTGNLDPENAQEVFKIFQTINSRGAGVLMATHNPDFYNNNIFRRLQLHGGKFVKRETLM